MWFLGWGLVLALAACEPQCACVAALGVIVNSDDCSKQDVNCTIQTRPPRDDGSALWTPGRPFLVVLEWSLIHQETHASVDADPTVLTPVLNITWWLPYDDSITTLQGTELCVTQGNENVTKCVWFIYSGAPRRLQHFSFHGFAVEPQRRYRVDVCNIPRPRPLGPDTIVSSYISVPGCEDDLMKASIQCILNGSMWSPDISVYLNESGTLVKFTSVNQSAGYRITLESCGRIHKASVIGGIEGYKQVTFPDVTPTPGCYSIEAKIKPYFDMCKDDCQERTMLLNLTDENRTNLPPPSNQILAKVAVAVTLCLLTFAMGLIVYSKRDCIKNKFRPPAAPAQNETPDLPAVQRPAELQRRKVFIVYSNDHRLFRDIVLRFAAFLQSKCGVAVSLDLWEERRVAETGRMQWLARQFDRGVDSAASVVVLFSRGSRVKWRALSGATRVELREDLSSPVGDLYSPALGLVCDRILRPATFEKYIVAYFEDVSSEADIPGFFHMTLKYKLMTHFKELFFRIQDKEQYSPGVTYGIDGISADDYFEEPCGRQLLEAIETFKRFQQSNPDWFESEVGDELHKVALGEREMLLSAAEGVRQNVLLFKQSDACDSVMCNSANLSNDFTPVLEESLASFSYDSGVSGTENSCSSERSPLFLVSAAANEISESEVHSHYLNKVSINSPYTSPDLLLNPGDLSPDGSDQQFGNISPNVLSLLEGFQRSVINDNRNSDLGECVDKPGRYRPQGHVMSALQTSPGPMCHSLDVSDIVHTESSVTSNECPSHSVGDDCSLPPYENDGESFVDQYNVESIVTERTMEELIYLQQQALQNSIGNI